MLCIKCCTECRAHVEIHIHGEITSGGRTATGENHVHKNKKLMCFSISKSFTSGREILDFTAKYTPTATK